MLNGTQSTSLFSKSGRDCDCGTADAARSIALLFPAQAVSGTLVIVIPSRDGLVVGADVLMTVEGKGVPGPPKVHSISSSLAFAITGTSMFVENPPPGIDLAIWLEISTRSFNGTSIMRHLLGGSEHFCVSDESIRSVGEVFGLRFAEYFGKEVALANTFLGSEICQPVILSYRRTTGIFTVCSFKVRYSDKGEIICDGFNIDAMSLGSPRYIGRFGETEFVDRNVLKPGSIGWRFLGHDISQIWNGAAKVCDMTSQRAVTIISRIIHATELTSKIVSIRHAVGGTPQILVLDGSDRPGEVGPM